MEEKRQDHTTAVKNKRRTETAAAEAHQADQPESLITQDNRMNVRVDLKLCLLLAVCVSSVLSCRWTRQTQQSQSKFLHHHGISLDLIRTMVSVFFSFFFFFYFTNVFRFFFIHIWLFFERLIFVLKLSWRTVSVKTLHKVFWTLATVSYNTWLGL